MESHFSSDKTTCRKPISTQQQFIIVEVGKCALHILYGKIYAIYVGEIDMFYVDHEINPFANLKPGIDLNVEEPQRLRKELGEAYLPAALIQADF